MSLNFEILDDIQKSSVPTELTFKNIVSLNKFLDKSQRENILHVNIRSLNANFNKLSILIKQLTCKPTVIVCSETWNLKFPKMYKLEGYKMFYNKSQIDKADGVVMYIKDNLKENTEILNFDKLKIINTKITIENNKFIEISALYRCHQLPEPKFIQNLKQFLITKRNIKNHFIIGDFNIDISALNTISLEHLNNLLEAGYCPGFTGITRPSASSNSGSCIDNIFFKTNSIKTKSFKLTNNITDHYSIFISISKMYKN